MIDPTIEKLALEHAQQLEHLGIFAAPKPGTPLSVLVSELMPGAEAGRLWSDTEDFDNRIGGTADELSDYIRGYLDFARNVAKPAIDVVTEAMHTAMQRITVDPFLGMNIVESGVPDLLRDSSFMNKVEHSNVTTMMPKVSTRFGARTEDELMKLCETGDSGWDGLFVRWIGKQPEGTLQRVWQGVFMSPTEAKTVEDIRTLDDLLVDYNEGRCSALVIYLIASRLYQNIEDDVGLDLDTARSVMYALMARGADGIVRAVNWFNAFVSTNTLVADINPNSRYITVNSEVFKDFLRNGGKSDVLMGLLVSRKRMTTVAEISANAEMLLEEWNNYALSATETSQAEYELAVRAAMTQTFTDSLSAPISDAEADKFNEPGVRENILRIFNETLKCYSREQIHENWVDVLWRTIAQSRFYYFTFVYELLDSIDYNVSKGGMEAESAARVATQKIVSRFFSEMMTTA